MAILDEILKRPNDIAALQAKKSPTKVLLDNTFVNFLYYAKNHWSYTASATTGGEALLSGTGTAAPCGGVATALKLVFSKGLGIADTKIEYIRVTGYLWTGPTYLCFDPKVKGNLRRLECPGQYTNGCIFNEHYYLACEGSFYDPCLSAAYAVRDQSIKDRFPPDRLFQVGAYRKMLLTSDRRTCILYMPNEVVAGFRGAWCMFDANKKNIEKALGSKDFAAEMSALGGNTGFARFVKGLR